MKEIDLTEKDVADTLKTKILIGSLVSKQKSKHFFYTPYDQKYSVYKNKEEVANGPDLEWLLGIYNSL